MRALLDTHAFLWFITADARLGLAAKRMIEDARYDLFLSVASIWEIAIKAGMGRLPLPEPIRTFIPQQVADNEITVLPVAVKHALDVAELPPHHRDPFDRLLVAQALAENVPILSADTALDPYGIRRVW
jgi:PIN domain nuclease of toxin-antitoxin system